MAKKKESVWVDGEDAYLQLHSANDVEAVFQVDGLRLTMYGTLREIQVKSIYGSIPFPATRGHLELLELMQKEGPGSADID